VFFSSKAGAKPTKFPLRGKLTALYSFSGVADRASPGAAAN